MTTIEQMRNIVSEKQCAKIDGVLVDLFTASAVVKVYDALNESNQAKFGKLSPARMADITWKVLK